MRSSTKTRSFNFLKHQRHNKKRGERQRESRRNRESFVHYSGFSFHKRSFNEPKILKIVRKLPKSPNVQLLDANSDVQLVRPNTKSLHLLKFIFCSCKNRCCLLWFQRSLFFKPANRFTFTSFQTVFFALCSSFNRNTPKIRSNAMKQIPLCRCELIFCKTT